MSISYAVALRRVQEVARERLRKEPAGEKLVPVSQALGRAASNDLLSPKSTPPFDSSAMDGYAVSSRLTAAASYLTPIRLEVMGTTAAGDAPMRVENDLLEVDLVPCVEVMTGAQFPISTTPHQPFDACIPCELATEMPSDGGRIVQIVKPATAYQHKRFAGSDFHEGDIVVPKGTVIGSRHIMALASLGYAEVAVAKKAIVGVWSTGSELNDEKGTTRENKIPDANGPYLTAALRELGVDAHFLGVIDDVDIEPENLPDMFSAALDIRDYDVLITTGGVSAGRFDFVSDTVRCMEKVHFQHVAMRPGHPVNFASMRRRTQNEEDKGDIAFFGLPGNPIASAVCFRFLVVPYLAALCGIPDSILKAKVVAATRQRSRDQADQSPRLVLPSPLHLDAFRHGIMRVNGYRMEVQLSDEQSPAKVQPFAHANCWVHIPQGHGDVREGDVLDCDPFLRKW